ncbi:MAG: hypothetical protein AB7F64_08520 [Gammaproteobacteria bacterium]
MGKKCFYDALKKAGETLLIFDNVEDYQQIEMFLPPMNVGYTDHDFTVIVTTRNQKFSRHFKEIILDPDTLEMRSDAIEQLTQETNCQRDVAARLAEALQYLTLAITQATAYIRNNFGCTVEEYLELLLKEQNRLRLLGVSTDDRYQYTVLTTWSISLDKLNEPTKAMIYMLAYLHPDQISAELLRLREDFDSNSIASLLRYSLIYPVSKTSVKIHRLLQEVVRNNMRTLDVATTPSVSTLIDVLSEFSKYNRQRISACAESAAHFEALERYSEDNTRKLNLNYHELLFQVALYYLDHDYNSAQVVRLLTIAQALTPTENFERHIKIRKHLAKAYVRLGNVEEARIIYIELDDLKNKIDEETYQEILLDQYYYFKAKNDRDNARMLLNRIVESAKTNSLKARCYAYLADLNNWRRAYLEKVINGKLEDLKNLPSWQTNNIDRKKAELEQFLDEFYKNVDENLDFLEKSLALQPNNNNLKERVRVILQLCHVVLKVNFPRFDARAVDLIIRLYQNELPNYDRRIYRNDFTNAAICLSKLFSRSTPEFDKRGLTSSFKQILQAEQRAIKADYGSESEEYKAISAHITKKQPSITDFFQRKRPAEEAPAGSSEIHKVLNRTSGKK